MKPWQECIEMPLRFIRLCHGELALVWRVAGCFITLYQIYTNLPMKCPDFMFDHEPKPTLTNDFPSFTSWKWMVPGTIRYPWADIFLLTYYGSQLKLYSTINGVCCLVAPAPSGWVQTCRHSFQPHLGKRSNLMKSNKKSNIQNYPRAVLKNRFAIEMNLIASITLRLCHVFEGVAPLQVAQHRNCLHLDNHITELVHGQIACLIPVLSSHPKIAAKASD